jgi:hypothetical protein
MPDGDMNGIPGMAQAIDRSFCFDTLSTRATGDPDRPWRVHADRSAHHAKFRDVLRRRQRNPFRGPALLQAGSPQVADLLELLPGRAGPPSMMDDGGDTATMRLASLAGDPPAG